MALPEYQDQIGLSKQTTPYQQVESHPQAFGVGLQAPLLHDAAQLTEQYKEDRKTDAVFAAAERELTSGTQLDAALREYKAKLKDGVPDQNETYPDYVARLEKDFLSQAEQIHKSGVDSLQDDLAKKNFDVRMRLQTQAYIRHVGVTGDAQKSSYRVSLGTATRDRVLQQAGDVTFDPATDLQNLRNLAPTLKPYEDSLAHEQQLPPDLVRREMAATERGMIDQTLRAYAAKTDYKGGLAILGGLIHPELRVGNDPKNPQSPSVLNGAATQAWQAKFEEMRDQATAVQSEKVAAGMGLAWVLKGVTNPKAEAERYVSEAKTPEEKAFRLAQAERAWAGYDAIKSRQEAASNRAETQRFKSAYDLVDESYGRDVDAALADGAFDRGTGIPLNKMQIDHLRQLMSKSPDDPEFAPNMAFFGDIIDQGPGWSDRWKSREDFFSDALPMVGKANALRLSGKFEQDKKRRREFDPARGVEHKLLDEKLRVALDYELNDYGENKSWTAADQWKQDRREWALTQYGLAEAQWEQDMKAGKTLDPLRAQKLRNQLIQSITQGNPKGRASAKTPMPSNVVSPRQQQARMSTTEMERMGYKRYKVGSEFQWFAPREVVPPNAVSVEDLPPGQR